MNTEIHQPNDRLFKQSMSNIRVAKEFFRSHLPSKVLSAVDLNRLQLENHSFLDEHYHKSASDVK